ncbi:hypothetical protein ACFSEO_13885 [Agromyces cerinus subsp. nitratus]|uniref:hypothetical protein n=1 Tax=Agromyces cerinus TaxID=33878 RepID=UPI00363E6FD4
MLHSSVGCRRESTARGSGRALVPDRHPGAAFRSASRAGRGIRMPCAKVVQKPAVTMNVEDESAT